MFVVKAYKQYELYNILNRVLYKKLINSQLRGKRFSNLRRMEHYDISPDVNFAIILKLIF